MPSETYYKLLNECSILVGNSSSEFRRIFIGVPTVNIGTRQNSRISGKNVFSVKKYDTNLITKAIYKQLAKKKLRSNIYGFGDAAKKIIKVLKK